MKFFKPKTLIALGAGISLAFGAITAQAAPSRGGILNFVVGSKIPLYDGHQESTFGMIHPIRPFYSTLIRINPNNPSSPTDFVCDLCEGDVPKGTIDGKKFTFKIRKDVKFHNGQKLTAHDIVVTHMKIISPPKKVPSIRKAFYGMVDKVYAKDDYTVVFELKYPSGAFIPSIASPYNFVYSKADLKKHGYSWHKRNVNGTGAFKFVQHQAGAFVQGERYSGYHHKGADGKSLPYLDGYKAIAAPKMALRVQAIRGNRASIEFRGFPPKARDDLKKALGKKITVQQSNWNCVLIFTPNHKVKPFNDKRVRRALTLAVDRRSGSKYLNQIAIVKAVGGVVFPGHPLAATKEELEKIPGYWPDIKKSRAEARRLLKEAGAEGLKFTLHNRGVDQPYKVVGTWLIGQWKKVGLKVDQRVQPSGPFYATLRKKKDFDVSIDFNCQSVVSPLVDVSKFISADKSGNNYAQYTDRKLDALYEKMNREPDESKQRALMREYETIALGDEAHMGVTLWWYKINPYRSYVKGWKIAPSHYLNQSLDQIWLDASQKDCFEKCGK